MKLIRTEGDLNALIQGGALSDPYSELLRNWLTSLQDAFDGSDAGIEPGCVTYVAEPSDTFQTVRLLLDTTPEYAEQYTLPCRQTITKIVVCDDNDAFTVLFVPHGLIPHLDRWITPYIESQT